MCIPTFVSVVAASMLASYRFRADANDPTEDVIVSTMDPGIDYLTFEPDIPRFCNYFSLLSSITPRFLFSFSHSSVKYFFAEIVFEVLMRFTS